MEQVLEPMEGVELSDDEESANISQDKPQAGAQGMEGPEDTRDAYTVIIEQQQQNIEALLEQTRRQSEQIQMLLRSGIQITDGLQAEQEDPYTKSLADLAEARDEFRDLGKLIGKRKED